MSFDTKAVANPINGNVSNSDRRFDNSGLNINTIAIAIAIKSNREYIYSPPKVFGTTVSKGKKDTDHTLEI